MKKQQNIAMQLISGLLLGLCMAIAIQINFYALFLVPVIFVCLIIVHELGHLIFGMLTGYSFISFRVGTFTLHKSNHHFDLKRYSVPGTLGQCLLKPPQDIKKPFILYNLGGGLGNLLFGSVIGFLLTKQADTYLISLGIITFSLSILFAITNLIPVFQPLNNDGANIKALMQDKTKIDLFYKILLIEDAMMNQKSFSNMDDEWFNFDQKNETFDQYYTAMYLLNYARAMEKQDYFEAYEWIRPLAKHLNKLNLYYQNEVQVSLVMIHILNHEFQEAKYYYEKVKLYLIKQRTIEKQLTRAYYAYYIEHNQALAKELIIKERAFCKLHPKMIEVQNIEVLLKNLENTIDKHTV